MLECVPMVPRSARRTVFVVAAILAFATAVVAQSGRRSSKPTTPTPGAPAISETAPTESASKKAPAIELLVGIDDPNALSGVPTHFADTVLSVCVHRLSEPAGMHVTAGPRSLSRSDAVKAAKAETARFVAWLQVGNSTSDTGRAARGSGDEYYVKYMVLEPGTAKVKTSGQVFYGTRGVGNIGIGAPRTARDAIYLEQVIREEARQAAERILSALGIKDTGLPPA